MARNFVIFSLFFASVLFFKVAISCPVDCDCSPDIGDNEEDVSKSRFLKIHCEWPHIPGVDLLSTFPHQRVYRLSVQCKTAFPRSRFTPSMFSMFTALRHLSIRDCHTENGHLPSKFLSGLAQLKTLHLENVAAPGVHMHFEENAFSGPILLEKLTLTLNNISSLPQGVLCQFKELKLLNLTGNSIDDLRRIGYDGCENHLVILDMSENRVLDLNRDVFRGMSSLHILRLGRNRIENVQKYAFQYAPRLKELYLSENNITRLDDLPMNVEIVDLARNDLRSIGADVAAQKNLIQLNLSRNNFDAFPSALGDQMTILDLSHNRLRRVIDGLFENVTNLQQLFLRDNRIDEWRANAFRNTPRLRYLDLSENRLERLRKDNLNGLQNLSDLILDANRLSDVADDAFTASPQLRTLSARDNALTHAPTALTLLYYLQRLDLSNNTIGSIPKFLFDKLPNLKELRLAKNRIRAVDRYVFEKLPNLHSLDLSSNSIEKLATNCFEGTTNIRVLRLDDNAVRDVQGHFVALAQLRTLNVSANRITHIDFAMFPLNLRALYASANSITHVGHVLKEKRAAPHLLIMDLSANKLKKLDADTLPNTVEIADFSLNNIAQIDDQTLFEKLNLTHLNLAYNQITELTPESVLVGQNAHSARPKLTLRGNPLRCTCKTEWIRAAHGENSARFLSNSPVSIAPYIVDYHELFCVTPWTNEKRPVADVKSHEFLCAYENYCAENCRCCDFDSCDCKSVCAEGCDCFLDSRNQSNLVRCGENFNATNMKRKLPMQATQIDLSGSKIDYLQSSAFFGRNRLKKLFLNHSNVQNIGVEAFKMLVDLETLNLSYNKIEHLRGDEFLNVPKLHRLALNDNELRMLPELLFQRLPALRELKLHNNRFVFLPDSIAARAPQFSALTLSGNPWRCDCDVQKLLLQRWLPDNTILVSDYQIIYCAENSHTSEPNHTANTGLAIANGQPIVKVNFWTFTTGINVTFCRSTAAGTESEKGQKREDFSDEKSSKNLPEKNDDEPATTSIAVDDGNFTNNIMLIAVAVSALVVVLAALFLAWRFRNFLRCKYSKYVTAPGSVNSSSRTTATTPVPLLQFDAFVSYSASEHTFVTNEIASRLEQEYPYYSLCMLYRDLPTSPCTERHRIDDMIISNMERSQRVITILTRNFLEHEWKSIQLRTAYQCTMREKQRKPIVIVVDELPAEIDPTLAHYLRMNRCLNWNDPMFWQKFLEAMPERSVQQESVTLSRSSHYSDIYGTIVPSRFL